MTDGRRLTFGTLITNLLLSIFSLFKDQQMAMKWTKKFINHFGGNSDSITIGGMSAGGQSVQFLVDFL